MGKEEEGVEWREVELRGNRRRGRRSGGEGENRIEREKIRGGKCREEGR